MATCGAPSSSLSFVDIFLNWWIEWQITFLMIISMSLQIFLVVAGFFRKHTAQRGLHASIWIAFLGIDVVAAYVLGLMLGSGCGDVFSLYAPILLFHLGATDGINAYSPADNELWFRSASKMALETVAAAHTLSRSADCPKLLSCGILLFIVGALKYAERIFALWGGSKAQILTSARPIYRFMFLDEKKRQEPRPHPLLVAGEWEWYHKYGELPHLQLEDSGCSVTLDNIRNCQTLQNFAPYINEVCLAYALFKIYRRRLIGLHIHRRDYDYQMVSDVLFADPVHKILRIIDLELSFIFDSVFSKGAAGVLYQGIGIVTRLVSLVLIFAAAMDLIVVDAKHLSCVERSTIHGGIGVLHVLVIAMLWVECTQIYKLLRSNWIRVWLACTYIRKQRLAESSDPAHEHWKGFYRVQATVICVAFLFVGKPKTTHWSFRVEQLSIAVDCLDSLCLHYLQLTEICYMWDVKECREKISNLSFEVAAQDLLTYIINKTEEKFKNKKRITEQGPASSDQFSPFHDTGLELAILNWHLATTVCEMELMQKPGYRYLLQSNEHIKMSIALSRYCLHLMIRRPKLMPEDRDVAKTLYTRFKTEIKKRYLKHPGRSLVAALLQDECNSDVESASAAESVYCGICRGRDLLREEQRWETLAGIWVDMLIYIAIAENAVAHTEQMGNSGELLTFLWVLLGHLGLAQTSISREANKGS